MSSIGSSLDSNLQSRAQNLHANSAALEKQQKELIKETEGLRKGSEKLRKLADEGARKVKELGNVQNWAEMLERDFLVLEETLRLAELSEEDSEWSTESEDGNEDDDETGNQRESVEGYDVQGRDEEGDIGMVGIEEGEKGKGKIDEAEHKEVFGGYSTATTGSGSDPSSSSMSASVAS
jgi:hypothetical protein